MLVPWQHFSDAIQTILDRVNLECKSIVNISDAAAVYLVAQERGVVWKKLQELWTSVALRKNFSKSECGQDVSCIVSVNNGSWYQGLFNLKGKVFKKLLIFANLGGFNLSDSV